MDAPQFIGQANPTSVVVTELSAATGANLKHRFRFFRIGGFRPRRLAEQIAANWTRPGNRSHTMIMASGERSTPCDPLPVFGDRASRPRDPSTRPVLVRRGGRRKSRAIPSVRFRVSRRFLTLVAIPMSLPPEMWAAPQRALG